MYLRSFNVVANIRYRQGVEAHTISIRASLPLYSSQESRFSGVRGAAAALFHTFAQTRYNTLALLLLLFSSATVAAPPAQSLQLLPAADAPLELSSKYGYLLVSLNVENPNASIEFYKLNWRKDTTPPAVMRTARNTKIHRVTFQGLDEGHYLAPLAAGWYQISKVTAPYFNLPYRINVESQPSWRFRIQKQRVNYIGNLTIPKERSSSYVPVRLHKRIATEYDALNEQLSSLLPLFPLADGSGVRDDFWHDLLAPKP